ncbi:DHH family phosphoesterase [Candidatus Bathyarchaeota archaeon]|nr:MAG: DHH family phosphoesterase [Candidatus Bathyarchaeota archaeon]
MDTWIFTHGDADGLCAGAIALAANPEAHVFFTHPYGLEEDLKEAKKNDKVIICDIAISESHLTKLLRLFSEIAEEGDLTYIDHHPLPENLPKEEIPGKIIHSLESSASELTYTLFQSRLDPIYARIAIMGAIGDYLDNTPLIRQLLKRWDKRTLYFESGLLIQGIEGQKRNYELKRSIVANLANNMPPSFDRKLVELAIQNTHLEEIAIRELRSRVKISGEVAYVLNFPFSHGKTATYAMGLTDVLVGIAGEERKNMIDMSLRACSREIDLNKTLRQITRKIGGSGGGHPNAAGARIPKEKFEDLLEEVNKRLKKIKGEEVNSL